MKTLKFMLAAATAIGLASASQAAGPLDGSTDFESDALDSSITTSGDYWTVPSGAEEGDYTFVSGVPDSNLRSPGAVAKFKTTPAKVLQLEGGTEPLTRNIQATGSQVDLAAGEVYVDTLVKFTVTPAGDTVTAGATDKLMIYLKEDLTGGSETTNLVVMASKYNPGSTGRETILPSFDATNVVVSGYVAPNEWHRLTVKAYLAPAPVFAERTNLLFKVFLDGVALQTSAADALYQTDQTVFPSLLGESDLALNAVGFAGSGAVDDLLFTTWDPEVSVVDFYLVLAGDVTGLSGDVSYSNALAQGTLNFGTNALQVLSTDPTVSVEFALANAGCSATWDTDPNGINLAPGTYYTLTVDREAAMIGATAYSTLAGALSAAAAGDTVTLSKDAEVSGNTISTAAATLDLNGKTLTLPQNGDKVASLTFTGTGAKTLKDGDLMGVYHELTITAPEGEDLTFDGMTFHASVKPHGSNSVFTATGCQFLCDYDKTGAAFTDGSTADVHSYGVLFDTSSLFAQADIVNNYFDQGRRAAVQASFAGDLYFYGNTVGADKLTSRTDGADTRYPALQIFKNGRVFIENNTFFGQYLGEPFALYNKDSNRSTGNAVVFNGNTVSNGVNYLGGYYVHSGITTDLVDPNYYFGVNEIGDQVAEGVIYKTATSGTGVSLPLTTTLALPTGYTTVYDWAHNDGTTAYFVNNAFANDLTGLADNDVLTAFPGADVSGATLTLNADATYKNKWTAAADQPTGTELEPGEKAEFSAEPTPQELAAITIVASDAVSNALATAGSSVSDYESRFETVATYDSVAGKWYAEVVMKAATTNTLQGNVNAGAAAVVEGLDSSSSSSVTFTATPGFYYWINYGPTLSANLPYNTERVLATGNTVQLDMPSKELGQTAGFYKVKVDIAPAPQTGGEGGQD